MTFASAPAQRRSSIASPFLAVGRFLVALAEASPKMRALRALSEMSDEDLAAAGKTRNGEIQRIIGASHFS